MDYRPLTRSVSDFQQPISAADVRAVTRAAFGGSADVVSAVELGGGFYNSTFKIDIGQERPVILRIAPEPARQARADPELMRNEYASVPYLAPIADLLPRNLAADFTHQVIGRDYLFQTMLGGIPAATALKSYPEQARGDFYRDLGEVTRAIHGVRGRQFGPVAGPTYERWSDALLAWFDRAAADLTDHGLDASAVTELMRVADRNRQVLDEVREPRLLHGDLWVGNTMLAASSPVPSISGVFDCDRTWWGDPEADWPIYLALRKPGSERDAFWSSYGMVHQTEEDRWRARVYEAKHAAALLLEYHRFGRNEEVTKTNDEIRDLTARLRG